MPNNSTIPDMEFHVQHDLKLSYLFLIIFPLSAVLGNLLVVVAIATTDILKKSVTNCYISSLAICDLLVGLLVMPLSIYAKINQTAWPFGDTLCRAFVLMDIAGCTASILHLAVISVDRYWATIYPVKYMHYAHRVGIVWAVVFVWLMSFLIALPVVLARSLINVRDCIIDSQRYMLYSSIGSFYIPAAVLLALYFRLFKKLKQRSRGRFSAAANRRNLAASSSIGSSKTAVLITTGAALNNVNNGCTAALPKPKIYNPQKLSSPTVTAEGTTSCAGGDVSTSATASTKRVESIKKMRRDSKKKSTPQTTRLTSVYSSQEKSIPLFANGDHSPRLTNQQATPTDLDTIFQDSPETTPPPHRLRKLATVSMQSDLDKAPIAEEQANPFRNRLPKVVACPKLSDASYFFKTNNIRLQTSSSDSTLATSAASRLANGLMDSIPENQSTLRPKFSENLNRMRQCQPLYNWSDQMFSFTAMPVSLNTLSPYPQNEKSAMLKNNDDMNFGKLRRCSSCVAIIKVDKTATSLDPTGTNSVFRKFTTIQTLRKNAKLSQTMMSNSAENSAAKAKDSLMKFKGVMSDFSKAMVKRLRKSMELRKEKKATKLVAIILGAFIMCWAPFFLISAATGLCFEFQSDSNKEMWPLKKCDFIGDRWVTTAVWMGYGNSCLNPILYAMLNGQFRMAYKKLLAKFFCRKFR